MKHLEIVGDVTKLNNEEYALLRKDSLGASDSSIILDVNLFKNKDQLILEKKSKFLTDNEKEVGKKPAVKKGRDLEPFVVDKFIEATGLEVNKPVHMYRHKQYPYLTVNFDGLTTEEGNRVPVEAKIVTRYGEKYYKKLMPVNKNIVVTRDVALSLQEHIKKWADVCGIPGYYYTQVQQQILFCDTEDYTCPYGYLACIFDNTWDFGYFYIPRDEYVISHLISEGAKLWEKVEQ